MERSNPAFAWTFLGLGAWFGMLWIGVTSIVAYHYHENPFVAPQRFPGDFVIGLGVFWIFFTALFAYALVLANAPPILRVGPDYVEGTPDRRNGLLRATRSVVIRYDTIRKIGWSLLGPAVITNERGPPGFGFLLSYQNARMLQEEWRRWRDGRDTSRPN